MKRYSTSEVARKLKVHQITLQRWISQRKIRAPRKVKVGKIVVRLWTQADLARVKRYKEKNFRRGRGRKVKAKA